jgi:hypothetical protein
MNVLYDKMWLYFNFFQPVLHLAGEDLPGRQSDPSVGSGANSLSAAPTIVVILSRLEGNTHN